MLVNDGGFARPVDFKRAFEVRCGPLRRISAAFCLTGAAAMPINQHLRTKGTSVRNFATSLILVSKRTAGGG
jgi:hypothetical protein